MAKKEHTKETIAASLKTLCRQSNIDKISVSDIVKHANINRQTFYYHFQDKQALICWIFDYDISRLNDATQNNTRIDDLVDYMYEERIFYISALSSNTQNSLNDHIYDIVSRFFSSEITCKLHGRTLTEENAALCCRFFSHALVGNIVSWAKAGMKLPPNLFLADFLPFLLHQLDMTISYYAQGNPETLATQKKNI